MTEALLISESEEEAVRVFQSYACDLAQSNAGAVVLGGRNESSQTVCQWGGQSDRFEALEFEKCWSRRSNKIYDTEMGICERSCGGVPQRQLCVPVSNAADCYGVIAVELNGADEAQVANVSEALTPAASVLAITISNLGLRNDLFHQSIKDPLTGLLNRRGWQEKSKRIVVEDAKDPSLSIINIDIDDFKKINDRMGMKRAIECWLYWPGSSKKTPAR